MSSVPVAIPPAADAERFIAESSFVWHQGFELVPGVMTPGVSSVEYLADLADLPQDLNGRCVLDVGTSNGGTALECERRGAARVVAVDVLPPEVHGIQQILDFVHSDVEYVHASVYELDHVLDETFDLVVFWGVLYHLRHPLLALDTLRTLCTGTISVETAVADAEVGAEAPSARFYRRDELGDDPSNWFAPTVRTLHEWLGSAGFTPTRSEAWPHEAPSRALVNAKVSAGAPEYLTISYERPLEVTTVPVWRGVVAEDAAVVAPASFEPIAALPIPPLKMRVLVGPTDVEAFDNPLGDPVFAGIDVDLFDSVVDFGCGCGRVARQLIQQRARPRRYVGIDLHRGMVDWCRANLAPHAPGFEFVHHDVHELGFNPGAEKPAWAPLPVEDDACSLFVAISVFTHVVEDHAVAYLRELRRVLGPRGVAVTTWFLFDKREFPMMQENQNALFINAMNPTNAVIYDREWLLATFAEIGLVPTGVDAPAVRGFQWMLRLMRAESGVPAVDLPDDIATFGVVRAGTGGVDPHLVGIDAG